MLIALHALDHSNALGLRLQHYEAHKAHIATAVAFDLAIRFGGPLLDERTGTMIGSLTVFEAGSLETVKSFVELDPFRIAGVWAEVRLNLFDIRVSQSVKDHESALRRTPQPVRL